MTVNYSKLNQVAALTLAALPDVVSLLEQFNKVSDTWYAAIDLAWIPFYSDQKRPSETVYNHMEMIIFIYSFTHYSVSLPS